MFQRRFDGSVDFYRDWANYKNGFGSTSGEFWLGNDNIHSLTSNGSHVLRIDLEAFNGETGFAEFSGFSVDPESTKYMLRLRTYQSGTMGKLVMLSISISNESFVVVILDMFVLLLRKLPSLIVWPIIVVTELVLICFDNCSVKLIIISTAASPLVLIRVYVRCDFISIFHQALSVNIEIL